MRDGSNRMKDRVSRGPARDCPRPDAYPQVTTFGRALVYGLAAFFLTLAPARGGIAQTLSVPAPASQSPIVGTWQLQAARLSMHISFKPDGTYQAIGRDGVINGRWTVLEGARLATWADDSRPRRINKFALNDDWLVIIDDRGRFHKHRRVP